MKKGVRSARGHDSGRWKGGKYINSGGYVMVTVKQGSLDRKHGWENYRPEHIVIMEKRLGRKLIKGEGVHHLDGDRTNNQEENLLLTNNNSDHHLIHHSLQKVGYRLFKDRKIRFNFSSREYELI
jgi:hypothetical protein